MERVLTSFSVAFDSYVHGLSGPILVDAVKQGEKLFCADSSGRLVPMAVESVDDVRSADLVRLFTPVGDPTVPAATRVVMKGGTQRASEVRPADKAEVLPAGSVPYEVGPEPELHAGCVLGCLPNQRIRIPAAVGDSVRTREAIETTFRRMDVAFEFMSTNRWLVFQWTPVAYLGLPRGGWRQEAEALMALTMWDLDGGISRSGVHEDRARRHLSAALFAAGAEYRTKWVPKYAPADCHLALTDRTSPAFVPVDNVRAEEGSGRHVLRSFWLLLVERESSCRSSITKYLSLFRIDRNSVILYDMNMTYIYSGNVDQVLEVGDEGLEDRPRRISPDHRTRSGHRHVPEGRTLHLVDIENLVGDPFAPPTEVVQRIREYLVAADWRDGDHVVVAGHPDLLMAARNVQGLGFRALAGYGKDGADNALLGASDESFTASRYCRVSIRSGDHAFTDLAAHLGKLGTIVWVVARRGSLARSLRMAAAYVGQLSPRLLLQEEPSVVS